MSNDDTDNIEILKLQKEVWEKAVDTQMHFNEMCVKSRQLGLTFVVAALGLSVLFLIRDVEALIVIPVPLSDFLITTHLTSVMPEIPEKNIVARTETIPNPPRNRPTNTMARLTIRGAIPPCPMIAPAKIKRGMASSANLSRPPKYACGRLIRKAGSK